MAADTMQARVEQLKQRREQVMLGGGADRQQKHRESGKLTARERIEALVERDSFQETGLFAEQGKVFYTNVMLSGAVPQISLICGPCAGGAAYSPALTDFIIQTRQAQMFITGPQVIKQVTGVSVTSEQLGGPDAHMVRSGVIHFVTEDDTHAVEICQRLLSFLPSNNLEDPPQVEGNRQVDANADLARMVPIEGKQGYDVRTVVAAVVDFGDFLEVQSGYAPNIVIGFGRVTGRVVGVIANQPSVQAGVLDINASNKASRFIRFCNAFNIPLLTFVDVPGFLPGVQQEHGGIIRHGAKMLFAYSAATVPKVTVILRKSYGGAHLTMCSKDLGADRVFAWPTAEMIARYREAFSTPYVAAGRRLVDDIIDPALTRRHVAQTFEYLQAETRAPATKEARADAPLTEAADMSAPPHDDLRSTIDDLQRQLAAMAAKLADLERGAAPDSAYPAAQSAAPAAPDATQPAETGPSPASAAPGSPGSAGSGAMTAPAAGTGTTADPGISDELLLVISAAVAAYLGERVHIRQVRLISSSHWAQQGRVSIQASHRLAP